MGSLIPASNIPTLLTAVRQQHVEAIRDPEDPHWFDATVAFLEALKYAEQRNLAYTEAIC
jgi:hypothetical protein